MPNRLIPKRSTATGVVPVAGTGDTQLIDGEVAINHADKILYARSPGGAVYRLAGARLLADLPVTGTPTTGQTIIYSGSAFEFQTPSSAGLTVQTATLNFGTLGVYSKSFKIANVSALVSDRYFVSERPDSDEYEMDAVAYTAYCAVAGEIIVYAHAIRGPVGGNRNIQYFKA